MKMAACHFKRVTIYMCVLSCYVAHANDEADDIAYRSGVQPNNMPQFGQAKPARFLLYDVNPGEGFNLRRDVYLRIANLVKLLNEEAPWTLVLPPWGRLYHWQSPNIYQEKIPWKTFFDIESLNRHVPVAEFEDYLKIIGEPLVEEVYYLQRYKEGWTGGEWVEKMDKRECLERTGYEKENNEVWKGWFFGYEDVYANKFECISVQSHAAFMKPFLLTNTTARFEFFSDPFYYFEGRLYCMIDLARNSFGKSVFIDRAEEVIHGDFGEHTTLYWDSRRSVVFAKHLREIGDKFRNDHLNSNDEDDKTALDSDWTKNKKKHGDALGGPYIGVHLRRKDYLHAHSEHVPSLKFAANQIKQALKRYDLKKVFVASDAPVKEFNKLVSHLEDYEVYRYTYSQEELKKLKDGGVAIIDQYICSHARHFIGTFVSTFSFRIHEEREIMGFEPETTFNRLCAKKEKDCEQPSKWKIVY